MFLRRSSRRYTSTLAVLVSGVMLAVPIVTFAQETSWIGNAVVEILYSVVVGVFGTLAGWAGLLLDYAINTFVIGFGEQYTSEASGLGFIVDSMWVYVRDIFNLTFIFGLVYIGFKMILRSDDSNTKRWLVTLILAALLVNFSLFFTKFVIDFSNLMATQIVVNGFSTYNGQGVSAEGENSGYGVAAAFFQSMGLQTLFAVDLVTGTMPEGLTGSTARFTYVFSVAFVLIIAAFVFAAGGIMLMVRFAALNFFMVLSPFMFIGWVFPPLSRYTSDYWRGFLGRAFYAPVYLLLLYFATRLLTGYNEFIRGLGGVASTFGEALSTPEGGARIAGFASTIAPFILVSIFLLASVVVAQKMSADGASTAIAFGNRARRRGQAYIQRQAGNATFGAAAGLSRATIGAGAYAATRSNTLKSMATSQKSGIAGVATRFVGKAALRTADTLADSSFDARKIGGVGKELGIGEGRKGGVKTIIADQKKRDDEMLKLIGTRDLTTPEAQQEVAARAAEITEREQAKKAELQSMRTVMANDKKKSPERLRQEINDLDARIAQMKLELNDAQQKQTLTPKELVAKQKEIKDAEVTITQKRQFEVYNEKSAAIQERDEKLRTDTTLSEQNKAELRAEREQLEDELQGINNAIQKNDQTLESAIKEAEQNIAKAADVAAAEVKYGNRIAYLKNMERSANFWRNPATGLLGGGASATASGLATASTGGYGLGFSAATAGGVAGIAAIAAIAAAKQSASITSEVKAELEKKYGKDALEMAKKDKQSDEEKRLARQLRELEKRQGGGGGDDAKKDDEKDDEKDDD